MFHQQQQNEATGAGEAQDVDIQRLQEELSLAQQQLATSNQNLEEMKRMLEEKNRTSSRREQGEDETDGQNASETLAEAQRIFKVVMVGDSGVGKTTFVRHLCSGSEPGDVPMTVGVDFYTKSIRIDGDLFSLKIWDTAGTERFRSITRSYYRDANGVILLYDVTKEPSYTNVRRWMSDILDSAADSVVILLVGNKSDLRPDEHAGTRVTPEHGRTLAATYQAQFAEVSARSGDGINEACRVLCRTLRAKEDDLIKRARAVDLHSAEPIHSSKYCAC